MGETIELTDIALRVIGAFYAFAGFVATRVGMMSFFLDKALAALTLKKPSRIERAQSAWHLSSAALVLAGGLALMAGLHAAVYLFIASSLGQAAYIFFVAPRYFDREDPPDPGGRRQTTNAFVIYTAATAFICWAAWRGRLTPLSEATTIELAAVGAGLLVYAVYVARTMWWSPRKSANEETSSFDFGATDPDTPSRPLHTSQRIKLMADYGCDPIWAMDHDIYGCFPPEELNLSPELSEAINAWSAAFEAGYNPDDPGDASWTDEHQRAHEVEGRRLAIRIKREKPELTVFTHTFADGALEVQAEEPV